MTEIKELSVSDFRAISTAIEAEVAKVIVGQADVVRHTLIGVLGGGHVLLEGVPGLGKTMLVRTFAQAMSGAAALINRWAISPMGLRNLSSTISVGP